MELQKPKISNGVNHQKSEFYFLIVFLTGIFLLTFFIFEPFFYMLVLAIVFATVFQPLHKKALAMVGERSGLAAIISTVCVFVIIVLPLAILGTQVFYEATELYSYLTVNGNLSNISQTINDAIHGLARFSPIPIDSIDVNQYIKQGLSWLLQHFGSIFANVARGAVGTFIFLISLYYFFKDGYKFKKAVITLSPLQDVHDEMIFNKLSLAINSVIKGSLMVAFVQGLLTTFGFIIFGIPNATLWGSVAIIAALVPGLGTALVFLPAIFYLFFSGETSLAFGLFIWGMVAVGLIDNFLGPKLVERRTELHPFLILLSILGGLSFFGPLGFLLGPLVLSLLFVLIEIYYIISKEQKEQ